MMKDLLPQIEQWRAQGDRVAIATVVKVEGSAPRPVGASMIVSSSGELAGSVSGGCVETAVFEEAQDVLRSGEPKLVRYGITDEMAWDVGLACGGTIEVFVEPVDDTSEDGK
jgi:xanthine/CO dehydrogenase XdhC/CoxF family maturation factor